MLAVSAITPLALLLVHVGDPARPVPELVGTRLAETVVGIVVALAAGFLLFRRASSRRLPAAVSRTGAVVLAAADGEVGDRSLRDTLVGLYPELAAQVSAAIRADLR